MNMPSMSIVRGIVGFFLFIASGLAVIVVGFFMLRGNMSMWDRTKQGSDGSVSHENHNTDGHDSDSPHKDNDRK